jgi:DNA-binding transcriptional LysR family regulator
MPLRRSLEVRPLFTEELRLALVPAMAMRQDAGLRLLAAPQPTRDIVAVWPQGRPPGPAAL